MREKKTILYESRRGLMLAAVSLCVSVLLGCGKTVVVDRDPDIVPNTAPTISLKGENPMNLFVGETYTEPGATATDTEDGDISSRVEISGEVTTSVAGKYTVAYVVTDDGGLNALALREVNVTEAPDSHPSIDIDGANEWADGDDPNPITVKP